MTEKTEKMTYNERFSQGEKLNKNNIIEKILKWQDLTQDECEFMWFLNNKKITMVEEKDKTAYLVRFFKIGDRYFKLIKFSYSNGESYKGPTEVIKETKCVNTYYVCFENDPMKEYYDAK